eukprot:5453086-Amphidinium_carterae.1
MSNGIPAVGNQHLVFSFSCAWWHADMQQGSRKQRVSPASVESPRVSEIFNAEDAKSQATVPVHNNRQRSAGFQELR